MLTSEYVLYLEYVLSSRISRMQRTVGLTDGVSSRSSSMVNTIGGLHTGVSGVGISCWGDGKDSTDADSNVHSSFSTRRPGE